MENELNAPAEKTPEQIEHDMLETRESLTAKVAALEQQVVGTAQTAADTLTGTVEKVKEIITTAPETVKKAAEAVTDTVKKAFDISGHVRNHPWTAFGVSAGLGFLTGWLTAPRRESLGYSDRVAPPPATGMPTPTRSEYAPEMPTRSAYAAEPPAPEPPAGPGVFGRLLDLLGKKAQEIAENAINTASAAVNKTVETTLPKLMTTAAERLTPDGDRTDRPGRYPG